MAVQLINGDCLAALPELADCSIDAIVTDPPYGLSDLKPSQVTDVLARWIGGDRTAAPTGRGFMGKSWDSFVPPPAVWDECLRVLKPGGHLMAFAGSRTVDLMGLSIRLAGFEIRDEIAWIYGSGFPKSLDVGKTLPERKGWGTALKPAIEPIVLARKPLGGTVAANVLEHGTGALNLDACRVPTTDVIKPGSGIKGRLAGDTRSATAAGIFGGEVPNTYQPSELGRWPANVALDEAAAEEIGSASRFFYVAKAPAKERPRVNGVAHPTVKPVTLMRHLVRLVTPPGGVVLDPFAGSGATVEAAMLEGFSCIAVERELDYCQLIQQRIDRCNTDTKE